MAKNNQLTAGYTINKTPDVVLDIYRLTLTGYS